VPVFANTGVNIDNVKDSEAGYVGMTRLCDLVGIASAN
jgi:hypothetical protein